MHIVYHFVNVLFISALTWVFLSSSVAFATGEIASLSTITEESGDLQSAYRLGPDDEIKITVFGEDELSGRYKLDGHGFISMPLIGELALDDLTLRAAESLIMAKLRDGYLVDPSVSIEVARHRPFYILGEVRAPGSYVYSDNMTVLKAVALAGGFTYRANKNRADIMRGAQGRDAPYRKFPVETKVYPGDVIVIRERLF